MNIKFFKTSTDAKTPTCAYNGTSAGYDLYATEDVVIPARGSALVPNDLRIEVPHGYYFTFNTRSGHGIKKNLVAFRGIVDASYTGELSVKIHNLSDDDVNIKKGEGYVQITFHQVIPLEFTEIGEDEWNTYAEGCTRGCNGFGSSNT